MSKNGMQKYTRIGIFSIEDVLPYTVFDEDIQLFLIKTGIPTNKAKKDHRYWNFIEREYLGHKVKMNSQRYQTFYLNGLTCVSCGMTGTFFALENNGGGRFHFNLYGHDDDGFEVLFTKDHILPKSKGGANTIDNYQTMCIRCNGRKGNHDE